jgi:alpha-tubulin suppressor-like RCC1 family protein
MPRLSTTSALGFGAPGGAAAPTATFTATPSSINEGSAGSFSISTTNFTSGTLYWTINHVTTSSADFSATSGSITISGSSGSFSITPVNDFTTEGAETFTVSIRTVSTSGTVIGTSASVTVNDTSTTVTATVTNSTTMRGMSNTIVRGGQSGTGIVTISVQCTGYNSQLLYWRINHGGTSSSHFTVNSGSFTTSGTGAGTITLTTTNYDSGGNGRTFSVGVSPDNFGTQVGVSATQTLYERYTVVVGQNNAGQVGDSQTVSRSAAVFSSGTDRSNLVGPVANIGQWAYNYYGAVTSQLLKPDGTLWITGANSYGGWGDNSSPQGTTIRSSPVQLTQGTSTWYGANGPTQTTIGLGTNQTVYTWGNNTNGATGGGTGVNSGTRNFPAGVAGTPGGTTNNFTNMNYNYTSYCITSAGASYGWGLNTYGQTGSGTITNASTPVLVSSSYVSMVGGNTHTIWLQNTGRVFSMGYDGYGSLGDNATINKSNAALLYPAGSSYSQIASSGYAGFAIDINGRLFGWGLGPYHGGNVTINRSSPTQLLPGTTFSKVDAGVSHAMAVSSSGTLYGWGESQYGSNFTTTTVIRSSPTQIMTGVSTSISGTGTFMCGYTHTVIFN